MVREDEVEMVKSSVSMKALASRLGYRVNRAGFISCPFHGSDAHPSMKVYEGSRGFYCFTCNKGGDIFQFVRETMGMSFEQSVRYVADLFGIPLAEPGTPLTVEQKEQIRKRKQEAEEAEREKAEKKARLKQLAADIQSTETWLKELPPYSFFWCRMQRKMEILNAQWEELFDGR